MFTVREYLRMIGMFRQCMSAIGRYYARYYVPLSIYCVLRWPSIMC